MLSSFFPSSLKTYKEDTNSIATWLAVKAKQCGYPPDLLCQTEPSTPSSSKPSLPPARLKGKARKQAKDAEKRHGDRSKPPQTVDNPPARASYIIKVRDFTHLAEYIVGFNKPVVEVPKSIATVLDRAIDLRRRHGIWSRGRKGSEGPPHQGVNSDESHSYFLGILERTREILKPRMPPDMIDDSLAKPISEVGVNVDSKEQPTSPVGNKFSKLNIHEPSQEFLDAPDITPVAAFQSDSDQRYEAETVHSREEHYLAAHCLFQDVRNIRSFLRQLWASYRIGVMELVAVSITTDTAIDYVRSIERDYLEQFPEKSDYESIVDLFYKVQCAVRGENPSHKQQPDDVFNFAVYDLAEECLLSTYTILASLQDVVSPGHLPVYKPGHFGLRDFRSDWSQKSPRAKFQDDKIVLLEAFPDLMLMTMMTTKSPLAEDELIRGLREMSPGKSIPLWLVFAAQCFLDTQHVLKQEIGRAHQHLVTTANTIKGSIKLNLDFHESLRIDNWPRTNDYQFSEMLRVIQEWVLNDVIAERLRKIQRNMPVADPEPFRLLKQYPLLCGLFTFVLKARAQKIGLAFANAWGSILYAGHLYNAARQEKLLPKTWTDLELLITLHSPEMFFVGDCPKNLEEYLKRFLLSMGYSATAFASNRRKRALAPSARGPRRLTELCKVGALFAGRYCNNDRNVSWTRESIQPIIQSKVDDDSDNDDGHSAPPEVTSTNKNSARVEVSATGALLRKPKKNQDLTTTVDFLEDLANALHTESVELSIDYLCVHRSCWRVLRNVNERCRPKLLEMYGAGYLEKENQLPFVVGYIFMTATPTSRIANLLLPRRDGGEVSSRLLATAAEAMKGMIDSGAGAIEIKRLEGNFGFEIDFSALDDEP